MKFAFQKMQLEADSLYTLVSTWAEMQLTVTENEAMITGYGFDPDIAKAFTTLVLDWEAAILLPNQELNLARGNYDLVFDDDGLSACRDQRSFPLPDTAVTVEVTSVEEE